MQIIKTLIAIFLIFVSQIGLANIYTVHNDSQFHLTGNLVVWKFGLICRFENKYQHKNLRFDVAPGKTQIVDSYDNCGIWNEIVLDGHNSVNYNKQGGFVGNRNIVFINTCKFRNNDSVEVKPICEPGSVPCKLTCNPGKSFPKTDGKIVPDFIIQ